MLDGNLTSRLDEEKAERLAKALGWFSLGLGAVQIAAPSRFGRLIGVSGKGTSKALIRFVGAREIAAGVGIFAQRRPAGWLWARVAGDAMDLALLGAGLGKGNSRGRIVAAMTGVAGVVAPDVLGAKSLGEEGDQTAKAALTLNRPREEVYGFWRDFANLPRFMTHLESVEVLDGGRSRWTAKAPAGKTVTWEADTLEDRPNELISWRALPGADVQNEGTVRFVEAPGGRGTEVHVEIRYDLPGGAPAGLLAKLAGREPEQQVKDDLRRFKQVLEVGEVVRSEGSPEGVSLVQQLNQRAAQPVESDAETLSGRQR